MDWLGWLAAAALAALLLGYLLSREDEEEEDDPDKARRRIHGVDPAGDTYSMNPSPGYHICLTGMISVMIFAPAIRRRT